MRLDESFRCCAVLIGSGVAGSDDEIDPWGTAFFVADPTPGFFYLVTAAHVVSDMLDAPFDIRFNVKGGGAKNFHIDSPAWFLHPTDPTVDVAVHEIEVPAWADVTMVPRNPNLALGNRLETKNIGAGNRTYTVGLWKFLHGRRRNQNYVYTGHIGLMPDDEKIPVKPWLPDHNDKMVEVEAYLVEGEPINGASGAPVFVRRTLPMMLAQAIGQPKMQANVEGSIWLLGLQSDAFFGKPGVDYEIPAASGTIVPRGVNVVVPVDKIIGVMDHPKLKEKRDMAKKAAEEAQLPMKTRLPPSKASEQSSSNPDHKEDFTALLNGAAKKTPQGG